MAFHFDLKYWNSDLKYSNSVLKYSNYELKYSNSDLKYSNSHLFTRCQFNQTNNLDLICRAHQLVMEGYKYMFDNQLVTVCESDLEHAILYIILQHSIYIIWMKIHVFMCNLAVFSEILFLKISRGLSFRNIACHYVKISRGRVII